VRGRRLTNQRLAHYNFCMKIFISHAGQDAALASLLAVDLSKAGFAVWNASEDVGPGDNWAKEIGRALDESDVMVALITHGAMQSEFLRNAIQYAVASKSYAHRLIPVIIAAQTVPQGVPWILLKLDPVYFPSATEAVQQGFAGVLKRVQAIAQQETNAPC
jgi:hypothetical protein